MTRHAQQVRYDWVDTARGASILLVITYHAALFAASVGLESNAWNVVNGATRVIRMPLFFFISGLLASSALARPWMPTLRRRVAGNLYLYVLWATLAFVLFSLVPYERQGAPRGAWHWVESTFTQPQNGLWYLLALALFTLAAKALNRFSTLAVLVPAALLSAVAGTDLVPSSFVWNNCLVLFVFFLAGSRLRSQTLGRIPRLGRLSIALPLASVVGVVALVAAKLDVLDVAGVRFALGAAAVLAGLSFSASIASSRFGRFLATVGRDTLGVYVTHEMLLALLVLPMAGLASSPWVDAARWFAPPVLVVVGTAAALALRKPLSKVPGLLAAPTFLTGPQRPGGETVGRKTDLQPVR
ncbi:acyltransferase family protein [Kineococcus endophyticus]|uniref:Acyltransferase family protein n=1 Tax=Kineococcus endophyticus TaxID=1181883 RepID=A0ABV3P8P9_9ACTN